MKNLLKHFGIIVITTIIAFSLTVCGGEDDDTKKPADDGLPSAGDGSINFSTAKTYQVMMYYDDYDNYGYKEFNGNATFTHSRGNALADYFAEGDYEVKITNGTLSIKLGTPKPEALNDASELSNVYPGTTVTDGLKMLIVDMFSSENDESLYWYTSLTDPSGDFYGSSFSSFIYANKKGKIQFYEETEYENYTFKVKLDMDLKLGWNIIIGTQTTGTSPSYTTVTGKPRNDHKWIYSNDD